MAGVVAGLLGPGSAEVNLRLKAPLDQPLAVRRAEACVALLNAEGAVVAEASPAEPDLAPPPAPEGAAAARASAAFVARGWTHSRGLCFCCGTVAPGGLRVFTGPLDGAAGQVAALWQPAPEHLGADGLVRPELLWAALDCGGAFAATAPGPPSSMLLARFTALLLGSPRDGEACRVLGWSLGQEGRKRHAGTALWGEDGRLLGLARALWVVPRPPG